MRVSGIATRERSVTTRMAAWPARPMPPPMVMPSMIATTGLGYRAIIASRRYSARKNSRASPALPLVAYSYSSRMSPPAEKPRSPAPSSTTTPTSESSRHGSKTSVSSRIIS